MSQEGHDAIYAFLVHQTVELARDCLEKSQEDQVSHIYFTEVSEKLQMLAEDVSVGILKISILPCSDKRKQLTNHPNLRKWCFRLDLAYATSILSLEEKPSSCWKIFKSR